MSKKLKIIGIIGPSGAGKSTIVYELLNQIPEIKIVATTTDRPQRINEQEIEHNFVTKEDFDLMISQNKFQTVVNPFGLKYRYGLSLPKSSDKPLLLMLRAIFVEQLIHLGHEVYIYQITAPIELAKQAMLKRGDKDQEIKQRLFDINKEISLGKKYAQKTLEHDFRNTSKIIEELAIEIKTNLKLKHQ